MLLIDLDILHGWAYTLVYASPKNDTRLSVAINEIER